MTPDLTKLTGAADLRRSAALRTLSARIRAAAEVATAALDLLNHGPDRDQSRIRVAAPTLIPRRSTATPKSR